MPNRTLGSANTLNGSRVFWVAFWQLGEKGQSTGPILGSAGHFYHAVFQGNAGFSVRAQHSFRIPEFIPPHMSASVICSIFSWEVITLSLRIYNFPVRATALAKSGGHISQFGVFAEPVTHTALTAVNAFTNAGLRGWTVFDAFLVVASRSHIVFRNDIFFVFRTARDAVKSITTLLNSKVWVLSIHKSQHRIRTNRRIHLLAPPSSGFSALNLPNRADRDAVLSVEGLEEARGAFFHAVRLAVVGRKFLG